MERLTSDFANTIQPFRFSEYQNSYSALLNAGDLYPEILEEYADGGGYSWDALAALYIEEQLPQYTATLHHDSEADMFCLYSNSEEAIYEFLSGFSAYIKEEERFRDLIERADFEAWD